MQKSTVGDLLRAAARNHPGRIALIDGTAPPESRQRLTYRELYDRAEALARALAARYAPGTHIAVWAPNSIEWVILQCAAALAGMPLVVLNANLRQGEVRYILEHSQSRAVFAQRRFRDSDMYAIACGLKPELPDLRDVFLIEDLAAFDSEEAALPTVAPGDCALVLYTSGTTGTPKGVLLSHGGITEVGAAGALPMGLADGSRWLLILPLASVGGSVFAMMGVLVGASTLVVLGEFDAGRVIRLIDEEQINFFNAPTTVHIRVLDHPAMAHASLASLSAVTCGGSTVAPTLIERIEAEFGAECFTTYGLTETSGTVTLIKPGDSSTHKAVTVGRPIAGVSVKIRPIDGPGNGQPDQEGEICVRSPGNMVGYFRAAEASAQAMDADGWLATGDIGTIDAEGFLRITGRLKDMVKRGGHNVYPREIEDLLARHPDVAESAIFAVPHRELGEEIAAAVRLVPTSDIDGEMLKQWLFPQLAPHKIPRQWHFVDSFPTNPNGKIQKFELRRLFAAASTEG